MSKLITVNQFQGGYKMKNKIISISISLILLISLISPSNAIQLKAGDDIIVGGMPFGVKFFSGDLIINGFVDVDSENGSFSPASEAGLKENDIVLKINEKDVKTAEDVTREVESSDGKAINFLCKRDGKELNIKVTPIKSKSSGTYKIGISIRDCTAGIGTVTYINKETGEFGGLGHGICSAETGDMLDIRRGIVCDVNISGIDKGKTGDPGELKGYFSSGKTGIITKNTNCGVFGIFSDFQKKSICSQTIKIAPKEETKTGKAIIYCTLSDNSIKEYDIEIVCNSAEESSKNFAIVATDPELIAETGGIVQGMSGSPIIQDGKLVGAVTHVLVNDPTKGYGIYIEDMLKAVP